MTAARVAVVGSGAWGTTLAILVAKREPAVLIARSDEVATRLQGDRANNRRLPGIAFPPRLEVSGASPGPSPRRPTSSPWSRVSKAERCCG